MSLFERKYAKLNKDALSKLQELEKETGKIIIAYEREQPSPYAELSEAQLEKIRRLEQELNIVLLAYKP